MLALVWVVAVWAIIMVTIKLLKDWFSGKGKDGKGG